MNSYKYICILLYTCMAWSQPGHVTEHIKVDQFGYTPCMQKIAVISNPVTGFNSDESFIPSNLLEVRKFADNYTVLVKTPEPWNNGERHAQSGDQVWWFDFSEVDSVGSYYIYDPGNDVSSYPFNIDESAYNIVLKHAVRTFYYQRCGLPKETPYAHSNWTDRACHLGYFQDLDCRLISNMSVSTSRNLSGGWHDAGDYNKYVNYAYSTLHDLLLAYEERPEVWNDDFNIPESGNDIPDLLDEVKWELDWLLKMQLENGSVLHKIAAINWDDAESPPSKENTRRCYALATASATIASCGVFAHAAIVYRSLENTAMTSYSDTLSAAALLAWDWIEQNPDSIPSHYDNAGFVNAGAELPEYTQQSLNIVNTAYLFVLTGENKFKEYFDTNYRSAHLFTWGAVHYIYDDPTILDGLLYYSKAQNASGNVVEAIRNSYMEAMTSQYNEIAPLFDYQQHRDAYMAYLDDYGWGSSQHKGNIGTMLTNLVAYSLDCCTDSECYNAAGGFIHYVHGINPLALVYLSNMNDFGAKNSVPEFYHLWFADGTQWDNVQSDQYGPAPGFLVGGPNQNYESPGEGLISPPEDQPPQKAYKSWNTSADHSWEITENQITYQAAYIRLLSKFVSEYDHNNTKIQVEQTQGSVLFQNYPNPFNASTTIMFSLPETSKVSINLFDVRGQNVKQIFLGKKERGIHKINWNAEKYSTGVYFCQIKAEEYSGTLKMLCIK